MPNSIGPSGLTIASQAELIANFTTAMQQIYGTDINLDQNSPDGQMMMIFIQAVLDLEDLLLQIYNTFDPDNAIGTILDQRVAINGIQRQTGTFTVQDVSLILSQSVNLYGLDQSDQPIFTVADNAGNQWQLQTTQLGVGPGTFSYSFQAAVLGAIFSAENSITVPVTVVLGVVSINNPTSFSSLGTNEESDAALKIRRQLSVSLPSQGYLASLLAALENIPGVTSAFIHENTSDVTDVDGVPSHSIWVIVAGSAAAADIANAIYTKRNAGCGMFGSISYTITQVDGTPFTVFWDTTAPQNLFFQFTATSINGFIAPNIALIQTKLSDPNFFSPGVNTEVNINELATLIQSPSCDPNTLVTNAGVSDGLVQILNLSGVAASGTFKISYNGVLSGSINWNDNTAIIQTKVRAVTGLSAAVVTGTIAGQSLSIALNVSSALALIVVVNNSLATSGPVAITFSYNENYLPILTPSEITQFFSLQSENIIALPMILNPTSTTVTHGSNQTFAALGGYLPYVYSIQTNNSGGSIVSSTGVYTAGASTGVTDVIKVTDAQGNTQTSTVSVI